MVGRPTRWFLPGGGIETGERIEEALAREYAEETGFSIASSVPFWSAVQHVSDTATGCAFRKICHFFRVRLAVEHGGPAPVGSSSSWVPVQEALEGIVEEAAAAAVRRANP